MLLHERCCSLIPANRTGDMRYRTSADCQGAVKESETCVLSSCRCPVCHSANGQGPRQAHNLPQHADTCPELLWPRVPGAYNLQQASMPDWSPYPPDTRLQLTPVTHCSAGEACAADQGHVPRGHQLGAHPGLQPQHKAPGAAAVHQHAHRPVKCQAGRGHDTHAATVLPAPAAAPG